ncbi:MAG TPA: CBS domain-containing protein, partial [Flavobacteriia bacterium]|nr:CBS domain-containing protein [Flavobacteriia bacterium]
GVLIGVLVYLMPPLFGEGYEVINNVLRGNVTTVVQNNIFHLVPNKIYLIIALLVGLVTFKIIAMSLTLGAGGVGGVFAPTLFTGSISGYVLALIINSSGFFEHQLSPINFAMVGMAGLLAGVLQAPLTAIFLIAEITGGYELFIPLMIVSSISFLLTKKVFPYNIYAMELAKKGELFTHNKDKNAMMLIDVDAIIEHNFISIKPNMKLGEMLKKAVAKSSRNLYPVVNKDNEFLGVVQLDDIRDIMFNKKMYKKIHVRDIMHRTPDIIHYGSDSTQQIMKKFTGSSAWNLPVVKDGKYFGFISKSKLLTAYRRRLIETSND